MKYTQFLKYIKFYKTFKNIQVENWGLLLSNEKLMIQLF